MAQSILTRLIAAASVHDINARPASSIFTLQSVAPKVADVVRRHWCGPPTRATMGAGHTGGTMPEKRALIVDDSRSARAFLGRILERHSLAVDLVESAEEAIEYLARQQPDVIFMDHLMPGMDGLQAVKHIKGDPRTATIPILMYTSQEGELYLSQARALGAIGVLPKQTRPGDVTKALIQLRLVEDRRMPDAPAPVAVDLPLQAGPVAPDTGRGALPPELGPVGAALLYAPHIEAAGAVRWHAASRAR